MLKGLEKLARYGDVWEHTQFEKPYAFDQRPRVHFEKRKRSKKTVRLTQNIWRAKRTLRRYISIVTQRKGSPAFATFTYAKAQHDMQKAVQDWRDFTRVLKKKFPAACFARVPEKHKSGAVHFHAVMWGLPSELPCTYEKNGRYYRHSCPSEKRCERKQRVIAGLWKRGFVDVQQVRDARAIGPYLAKYLTKGKPDWSLFGLKVVSCNTAMYAEIRAAKKEGTYWELSSSRYPYAIRAVLEEWGAALRPRRIGTFTTEWLGDARFTVYESGAQ